MIRFSPSSRSCSVFFILAAFLYVWHMMRHWHDVECRWRVSLPQLSRTFVVVRMRRVRQSPVVNVMHVQRTEIHLGRQELQRAFIVRAAAKRRDWWPAGAQQRWRPQAGKCRLRTFHVAYSTNQAVRRWAWIISGIRALTTIVFRRILRTLLDCTHHVAVVLQQYARNRLCNLSIYEKHCL